MGLSFGTVARCAMLSMRVTMEYEDGETVSFEADERFRTAPSPILFDDLRAGEDYDARLYEKNWAQPIFTTDRGNTLSS